MLTVGVLESLWRFSGKQVGWQTPADSYHLALRWSAPNVLSAMLYVAQIQDLAPVLRLHLKTVARELGVEMHDMSTQ